MPAQPPDPDSTDPDSTDPDSTDPDSTGSDSTHPAARPPATDDAATVALLLSVVGLLGCLPVGAAGLAMGYVARARIRDSNGALGGERIAHAAVVVGWIAIGISVVALIVLLVLMAMSGTG